MIGCYATGIFPRPSELIEVTRAYERGKVDKETLEKAFEKAASKIINEQLSYGLDFITDGMLKWQDLLRPFTENLKGVKIGSLTRWFNNNTFYRKPIMVDKIQREKSILEEVCYIRLLPEKVFWKAILPAPYTFVKLSENQFYKNEENLMFDYAQALRKEIEHLANLGFKYIQLSDPALVYEPAAAVQLSKDEINKVKEALKIAVKGAPAQTCLQTFFGNFARILPDALDFPVDHLGIDLYETSLRDLKAYSFEKGIALGLVDSRSSLIENVDELVKVAVEIIDVICHSKEENVFICPNCDLEFLPWERAREKIKVASLVAKRLRDEYYA